MTYNNIMETKKTKELKLKSLVELMEPEDLKAWRNKHGFSQSQLARVLGTHVMTISQWERGIRRIPSLLFWALKGLEKTHQRQK